MLSGSVEVRRPRCEPRLTSPLMPIPMGESVGVAVACVGVVLLLAGASALALESAAVVVVSLMARLLVVVFASLSVFVRDMPGRGEFEPKRNGCGTT